MMKEYHGRDVVDNAAVAVVSTESVCDDLNEKSCSDFFAAVPESARMQNSDVLSNFDSKLSHLSAHERQILSNLFSEHPDKFSDNPGCTSTIVHNIDIGEAHPIKQHPYRMNVSKLKIVQDEIKYLLAKDKIEPSYSDWSSPVLLVPKSDSSWRCALILEKSINLVRPIHSPSLG